MSSSNLEVTKIVNEACKAHQSLSSAALAKMVYAKNKDLFKNSESVRCLIRYRRGAAGPANRLKKQTISHAQPATSGRDPSPEFVVNPPKPAMVDIQALIKRRVGQYDVKHEASESRRMIRVDVNVTGPFAVAHFGDPHLDDDGTDLARIKRHVEVIKKTPAMFAGNVGDTTNNWIGRLAHLWAKQSVNSVESWALAKWLFTELQWLYIIGGNHDAWSGDRDPLEWIAGQQGLLYEMHGARLNLVTPNGRAFRINARHDFKGHSMWNTAHGAAKAVQMGWRDHVLTCGHTHVSGYQMLKDPASGLISHCLRVASYKVHDDYALANGFPDQRIFDCPVTIFNPQYADDDTRCVTFLPDPEHAASYLTWLRKKSH